MAKKKKQVKRRDELAYAMAVHSYGAGDHGNKKKQASRDECRKKIKLED